MSGIKKRFNESKRRLVVTAERLAIARVNTAAMEQIVLEMQADAARTTIAEHLLAQSRASLERCEAAARHAEDEQP